MLAVHRENFYAVFFCFRHDNFTGHDENFLGRDGDVLARANRRQRGLQSRRADNGDQNDVRFRHCREFQQAFVAGKNFCGSSERSLQFARLRRICLLYTSLPAAGQSLSPAVRARLSTARLWILTARRILLRHAADGLQTGAVARRSGCQNLGGVRRGRGNFRARPGCRGTTDVRAGQNFPRAADGHIPLSWARTWPRLRRFAIDG